MRFFNIRAGGIVLALISLSQLGYASEIDSFTFRYVDFQNGLPSINDEVNRRIEVSLKAANRRSGCSVSRLERALKVRFLQPLCGKLESFANHSKLVPMEHIPVSKSIYKDAPSGPLFLMKTLGRYFGHVIRDERLIIGTDKFGHFFDEGYHFYSKLDRDQSNINSVFDQMKQTEVGFFGLATSGVKSYADMVADYQGMRFWSEMLTPKFNSEINMHYLKCENDHWLQIRKFDFHDYLDAGWDEGVNCSEFKNKKFTDSVNKNIAELEHKTGRNLQCPIFKDECPLLVKKYGGYAAQLLSPKCCE